jgi:hypothetical protein
MGMLGLALNENELASGVPDVGTLHNWEIDVAVGYEWQYMISQITKDATQMMNFFGKKLQVTLATDRDNHKGFDRFVKMIIFGLH